MGIHVLILAETELGGLGGGESVIHGLVRGLAAIDRGDDRITIFCPPSLAGELQPFLASGMKTISRPAARPGQGNSLRSFLGPLRQPLGRLWRAARGQPDQGLPMALPALEPWLKSFGHDVTHFMVPMHYATGGPPAVFTVHDLQHEHLPDIFDDSHLRYRRMLYDAVSRDCRAVVAISRFTAQDFQAHHPCPSEKLATIFWAAYVSPETSVPTLSAEESVQLAALPGDFILYPAFSYRHKNHARLLEALSLIEREQGVRIPLVCTGGRTADWDPVKACVYQLHPQPHFIDLAYTSRAMLQRLYQKARFVVFPSLFEGAGLPLLEAMRLGRPVACSDIPPFREFGGAGPAFFDPGQVSSIASVIHEFWTDDSARSRSTAAGAGLRTQELTWERCARSYLAVYRQTAGAPLSDEDHQMLLECRH